MEIPIIPSPAGHQKRRYQNHHLTISHHAPLALCLQAFHGDLQSQAVREVTAGGPAGGNWQTSPAVVLGAAPRCDGWRDVGCRHLVGDVGELVGAILIIQ